MSLHVMLDVEQPSLYSPAIWKDFAFALFPYE
jgi:hypothetical protein